MKNKKNIIWSSRIGDLEDWKDENGAQMSLESAIDLNQAYLKDEICNLNVALNDNVVAIATLSLWNGTVTGFRLMRANLNAIFDYGEDYNTYYVDGYKNVCCDAIHHDGTNHVVYRVWKDGLSDTQKANFLKAIREGKYTSAMISRYTRRLGDLVFKAYYGESAA